MTLKYHYVMSGLTAPGDLGRYRRRYYLLIFVAHSGYDISHRSQNIYKMAGYIGIKSNNRNVTIAISEYVIFISPYAYYKFLTVIKLIYGIYKAPNNSL